MPLDLQTGRVVIVGAGQAAAEAAGALRTQGFKGSIVLLGEESWLPYRRPPLSKSFLAGTSSLEALYVKADAAFRAQNVHVQPNGKVVEIDRIAKHVRVADGTIVPFDKLVLATGGRPRRLSCPGAQAPNVHYVRTVDDARRLQTGLTAGARLAIIGGGYIGLEVAAVAKDKGLDVTVIEAMPRVLARVAVPQISAFYEEVHRSHGVNILTGVGVERLEGDNAVEAVVLSDGSRLAVDLIVAGIGLLPNVEVAQAAGLEIDNGIVVDAFCQTSDPDILACGDCTQHENRFYQRHMRVESVPNAIEQARVVAATLCGKPKPYAAVPWFWSDQYDVKLQMVGLTDPHDEFVLRGSMADRNFCAFYLKDGVVVSVDAVNRPQDFMVATRMVGERLRVSAAVLSEEKKPLKELF